MIQVFSGFYNFSTYFQRLSIPWLFFTPQTFQGFRNTILEILGQIRETHIERWQSITSKYSGKYSAREPARETNSLLTDVGSWLLSSFRHKSAVTSWHRRHSRHSGFKTVGLNRARCSRRERWEPNSVCIRYAARWHSGPSLSSCVTACYHVQVISAFPTLDPQV